MLDRLNEDFRFFQQSLGLRAQRQEVLSSNIANADTPNYKARDLEFGAVLEAQQAKGQGSFTAARTSEHHIAAEGMEIADPSLRFRTPHHASLDQNTVDLQIEQASYAQNAVDFQASFTLLNSKFRGLMNALRGE